MGKEKQQKKIEVSNQGRIRTLGKKENVLYLRNGNHQISDEERKIRKDVNRKNENATRNQGLQQESHQCDKHLSNPSCKILGIILKMNNQTNSPKYKIDDSAQGLTPKRWYRQLCQEEKEEEDWLTLRIT